MQFVARSVSVQLCEPPFPAIRRGRAIHAPAMPMPEAAVDEDGGFVFRKKNVSRDSAEDSTPHPVPSLVRGGEGSPLGASCPFVSKRLGYGNSDMQAKTVAHSMQQCANGFLRRRVFAANAAHVPRAAFFG
jgi:hypothetical protein